MLFKQDGLGSSYESWLVEVLWRFRLEVGESRACRGWIQQNEVGNQGQNASWLLYNTKQFGISEYNIESLWSGCGVISRNALLGRFDEVLVL